MNAAAAVWIGLGLSVAAQNCNSLNVSSSVKNQDSKLSAIAGYKSDIILLSDVRMNGKDRLVCDKLRLWYNVLLNSTKNSRGVAILISNKLDYEVLETAVDPQENGLLAKLSIKDCELAVDAVYGPNTDNCGGFFDFLRQNLNRWRDMPCVLGGDWNITPSSLPVHENPDVLFMRSIPSRIRSEHLQDLCTATELSDPFCTLHPDARDFTYAPSGTVRKNRSHIDFFLVSPDLYAYIQSCTVAQGYCRKNFDHKPIFLSMKKRRGKGRLCVYNDTVDNPHAEDLVRCAALRATIMQLYLMQAH